MVNLQDKKIVRDILQLICGNNKKEHQAVADP